VITVLDPGPLLTVQDLGRPGYAALGVPRSGAFDRGAHRLANRLVGNPEQAAGLEFVLTCALRLDTAATVALAGAPCPGLDWGTPVSLPAGTVLRLAAPATGLRGYLAVRGGIAVGPVLGSRSTDTLSGLGPARPAVGDVLTLGPEPDDPVGQASAIRPRSRGVELRLTAGPRADWFRDLDALTAQRWTVRPDSDRVGLRLDGPPLVRTRKGELPSEATIPGAVQVPPDGRPILFGPDAPVSGGYPVVAVVREADLDLAAQLRPGDPVRLRWLRS
jgi:biotin-dependent carboxylase-like uncharacterized protein